MEKMMLEHGVCIDCASKIVISNESRRLELHPTCLEGFSKFMQSWKRLRDKQ
jgi:hypothetical protein